MTSAGSEFDPGTLWSNPDKFLVHFDGSQACFAHMDRAAYSKSIFTDAARLKPAAQKQWAMPLSMLLELYAEQGMQHSGPGFIFHPAHCGSTLLARLLDHPARALVIREPFALRQLATSLSAAAVPDAGDVPGRTLRAVLSLLARSWNTDQKVVVKANVPVNFILPLLTEAVPEAPGIILHASFEYYLVSILRTPRHQQWVNTISAEMAAAIQRIDDLAEIDISGLAVAHKAALLWIAQMHRFHGALGAGSRIRSLDCELLFSEPGRVLQAAVDLFGLNLSGSDIEEIICGGALSQYAKDPTQKFSEAQRTKERRRVAVALKPQIDAARTWAEPYIESLQAPAELTRRLVD